MQDLWTGYRVSNPNESTAGLVSTLADHGLVLLDDMIGPDDLLRLASSIATIVPHRDSGPAGITTIADVGGQIRSGFAAFSASALNPHTDRSGVSRPPALLMMLCGRVATSGGDCVVIDGKSVYDDLADSNPEAVTTLSAPRSVLFGGASGYLGSVFTDTDDRISIRLRLDELAQFSPEVTRWLPALRAAIDRHARTFRLNSGQGYLIDNHRWLHGRRSFIGQRVMYRINANLLPHLGIKTGFLPACREVQC